MITRPAGDLVEQANEGLNAAAHPSEPREARAAFHLRSLPESTLQAIVDRLPMLGRSDQQIVSHAIRYELRGLWRVGRSAATVANLLAFAPELGAIGTAQWTTDIRRILSRGLHEHGTPLRGPGPSVDYLHEPAAVRDAAAAFVLASHLASFEGLDTDEDWSQADTAWEDGHITPSAELLAVVGRHLKDPHRIMATAIQRQTTDPAVLETVLSSPTPAIAEGLL